MPSAVDSRILIRQAIPADVVDAIRPSFEHLPVDAHLAPGYRYRAMTRYRCCNGRIEALLACPLFHPDTYNSVNDYSGKLREYPDIEPELRQSSAMRYVLETWSRALDNAVETVTIHQFRTTAPGQPAPEGKHRDGNDWGAICVIDRGNLMPDSGVTTIWDKAGAVLFEAVIQPGEMVIFDDRQTMHYTTAIGAKEGRSGWRDVLIFGSPDHQHYLEERHGHAARS